MIAQAKTTLTLTSKGVKLEDTKMNKADHQATQGRIQELENQVCELHEKLEAMKALQQTALDITSQLEMPQLLETIVRRASSLMDATGGAVYLQTHPGSQTVEAVVSYNLEQDYRGVRLDFGQGIGGRVAESGQPLIINDYHAWQGKAPQLQDIPPRAILAVPLTAHGQTHGTLEIIDLGGARVFTQADLERLLPFAHQAAAAVENALLYRKERTQRETANALREAAEIISRTLDLDQILTLLLNQLEKLVPYDGATIQLVENGTLRTVARRGVPSTVEHKPLIWENLESEIWQSIIYNKTPVLLPDVHDEPHWKAQPGLEYVRAWIGIPIITRDWVWGILTLAKAEPNFYGPQAADMAASLARYAAAAIENAQLYASAHHLGLTHQKRAAQLASLQATNLRLSATLDLDTVLQTLAKGALELTPADDTHIYFYEQDTEELSFGTALWRNGRREPAVTVPRSQGLTATVAQSGKPLIINDAPRHPMFSGKESGEWGVQAIAGLPLKRQERVIGVFTAAYLSPHTFSSDEISILGLLADQAAVAIENARLYQQLKAHRSRLEAEVAARTFQLRQEKERADAILTHAADGVTLTDAQGVIKYVNPSWERLTGYSAQQALGQTPRILQSGDTSSETYREMWETITACRVWRGQMRDRRADGSLYDVDLTIAPVTNEDGEIVNFVGVHRDITAQKEVARLKDQFVSQISDELRTPITNLKLYTNLLQRGKPEKRDTYFKVIAQETAHLEKLVTDLLDFSQLDQGSITLAPEQLNLNALAAQVVNQLGRLAAGLQVELNLVQMPDLPPVWVDLIQMSHVLTKLVTRALEDTPAGGQVRVHTGQAARAGRPGVTLTVQDSGAGLSAADQKRIFERFFRAPSPERETDSSSLRLAIVKKIVELHDGQIQFQSQPGQGSTFSVWLPICTMQNL